MVSGELGEALELERSCPSIPCHLAEINKLKAKTDKAEANTQIEYYKQIDELKSKQATVNGKLAELKEASEDAWEDLKSGVESAWDTLDSAI